MKRGKAKVCRLPSCENEFQPFLSTEKYCSALCAIEAQKASEKPPKKRPRIQRIKPISKKRQSMLLKYDVARAEFLGKPENKRCPVTKQRATEIHHKRGRTGYADEWARENNVPLLIDKRFFLAVSRDGHRKIEDNPEWAYENEYSLTRTNTL